MTRKHFEAIAAIIDSQIKAEPVFTAAGFDEGFEAGRIAGMEDIAKDLADYFSSVNPNFDRHRFLNACGI